MSRPSTLQETLPGFGRIARRLWPYTRKHWPIAIGSLAALLTEIALRALEPWPLKFVFDYVLNPRHRPVDSSFITLAALALVILIGLRACASYLSTVGFALVGNRVLTEVRGDVYRHLQLLSLGFHNRARGGDLVLRVIGDIGMLKDVAVTAVLPLMANVLVLLSMLVMMLVLNWKLALVALSVTPLFWVASSRLSRGISNASRDQRRREGAMASTAAESLGAIRTLKALSLEERFAQTFAGQNRKSLKEGVKASRLAASLERSVDLLIALATALVLWYGARLALRGEITPGDLLVFLAYLKNAFKPVQDFAKYTGRLAKATAAGERVIDILDRTPDIVDHPDAVAAPNLRGEVKFEHVSFAYEEGPAVLSDLNLTAGAGQTIAIIGASGNGKSTLISLLLRLYDPARGCIKIDGHDIRCFSVDSLRTQISVVMQETLLFAASIRDNIAYGLCGATIHEVESAARLANADEFIRRLPDGYETIVGERGVTLSAGQRQRIAIARAAIRRTPILILDEPTSGLDKANEQIVIQALERLAQHRTTFLITHNLQQAARADLIILLEHGRVLELGKHHQLISQAGPYAAMFRLQARTKQYTDGWEANYATAG
jgi:ATP-binding cassette, subfamily B, bacterial